LALHPEVEVKERQKTNREQGRAGTSGHKSIVTTMDVYTVEIPASMKKMVERDEAGIFAEMKKNSQKKIGSTP
jgi:hypothetical protein